MPLTQAVGSVAVLSTVLCQLVGVQLCVSIIRKGSTDLLSPVPFITFLVKAILWTVCGMMKSDVSLLLTNCCCTPLPFLYIIVFYRYTIRNGHMHRLLLVFLSALFSPLIYIVVMELSEEVATRQLGSVRCFLAICGYVFPSATIREIMQTKSTESMSLLMVVLNCMCALSWGAYGNLINDYFAIAPNALGLMFCAIQ